MEEHGVQARPQGETCPACGAPADRGQLVCLECGSRIALDYRRPFSWKLPVAIITAVLVLAGAGFAYALSEVDDDAESEAAQETSTRAPTAGEDGGDKNEAEKRTAEEGERDEEAKRKTKPREPKPARRRRRPPPPARPGTWPRARNGFTVVLATTEDRGSAVSLARNVRQRGNSAGYLRSNDFSSLESGMWIVFSGVYRTRGEADRATSRLGRAFPDVFPQYVNGAESARRR